MKLAHMIVSQYHGDEHATLAENTFIETFQKGGVPDDVLEITADYTEALLAHGVVTSKTELRRLLEDGGVRDAHTGDKLTELPSECHRTHSSQNRKTPFREVTPIRLNVWH